MKEYKMTETFDKSELDDMFSWYHEPSHWELRNNQLHIFPDAETDFWQKPIMVFRITMDIFYIPS